VSVYEQASEISGSIKARIRWSAN